jgi:hypothetical protein
MMADRAFAEFSARLPGRPYATDSFERGLYRMPRAQALERAYIESRSDRVSGMLPIDLDREDAGCAHLDADLPQATFIVQSPSGRAHAQYLLAFPVKHDEASRSFRYLAAVQRGYTRRLGGDPAFSGRYVKNPCAPHWRTIVGARTLFTLDDLAAYLDFEDMAPRQREVVGFSRNVELFNAARRHAYATVRDYADEGAFAEAVLAFVAEHNAFAGSLPLESSSVRSIARSVTRWTWPKRDHFLSGPRSVRRGALGLPALPPVMSVEKRFAAIAERRAEAGRYAARIRAEGSRERIAAAVRALEAAGARPTQPAVAEAAGVGLRTVERHAHLLRQNPPDGVLRDVGLQGAVA